MYRRGIGYISFVWGNDGAGFQHIITERAKQGIDGVELIRRIPEIILKGKITNDKNNKTRKRITYKGERVIIDTVLEGEKVNWVLTGFVRGVKKV